MGLNILGAYALNFGIMIGCFVPAYIFKTDKFYDLTGSLTHILVTALSLLSVRSLSTRQTVQGSCIILWACRLGLFLFIRVLASDGDRRFDEIIPDTPRFFRMWILQAVWVCMNTLPSFLCIFNSRQGSLTTRDYIGWSMFVVGFVIETLADYQKTQFKADPANKGKFISHGMWSISRHPNYFGEALLWAGLYVSASSVFTGLDYISVVCPIFIYYLLTRISGIPALERNALKKWGKTAEYQHYLKNTAPMIPFWHSY